MGMWGQECIQNLDTETLQKTPLEDQEGNERMNTEE
jgi:hypothetical protein